MTYQPHELYDPVPGNIGLYDDTVVMLHFDEPTALQPSDSTGNLDDLTTEPGITAPASVETWSGFGRRFLRTSLNALLANDITGRDTLLQKDATIQCLISLTLTGAAGWHTIIARGLNDGSIAERYSIGLEVQDAGGGLVDVRFFWQDSAGVVKAQTAGQYKHPGDGKEILLTATRRWESSGRVVLRYYADDVLLAEVVSVDGDISGGTTARTTFGARKAAGVWSGFLNGTIDELLVADREMSAEEIHHTYKRLTDYQPGGVETYAGLSPVGLDWYKNPSSSIGRYVKLTGLALGFTVALIEELLLMWLPDKAPLKHIIRWERLCGLSAKPRDSLDVRRARVVAYLQREAGFSHPAIKAALESVMDCYADDIELLEFCNEIRDDFATLSTNRWLAGDVVGAWTSVAGQAHLAIAVATNIGWNATNYGAHLRTSLDTGGGKIYLAAKLSSWGALPASCGVGIYLHDRRTPQSLLWFGVYNDAGTHKIGHRQVVAGVEGAFVAIVNAPVAGPVWLRIHMRADLTTYRLQYSTIGAMAGFATTELVVGAREFDWGGFLAIGPNANTAGAIAADFDDYVSFCREGVLPFIWYAYRDPVLGGEPDMVGAHLLAQKIKPAHTFAAAIEGTALICDDPVLGLCDRVPIGA